MSMKNYHSGVKCITKFYLFWITKKRSEVDLGVIGRADLGWCCSKLRCWDISILSRYSNLSRVWANREWASNISKLPKNNKIDTVGRLLPTDVKISDESEILVKGENVMNGYFKDPDATKNAFSGEWLKTGDVGVFDKDDYLVITDRMKDIIVNSGGDNISPTKIETMLVMEPELIRQWYMEMEKNTSCNYCY